MHALRVDALRRCTFEGTSWEINMVLKCIIITIVIIITICSYCSFTTNTVVTVIKPWLIFVKGCKVETLACFFWQIYLQQLQNITLSIWMFINQFKQIYLHKLAYLK